MAEESKSSLDALSALCKRRGFIYHSSEIYGGMPGFWDYGPLGCELKANVKQAWWQFTVRGREDVAGLDATIIMHPKIWKASGHLGPSRHVRRSDDDVQGLQEADARGPDQGHLRGPEEEAPAQGRGERLLLPLLRRRAHGAEAVQFDVQDRRRSDRRPLERRVPPSRDGAGDLRAVPERHGDLAHDGPLRHRADGQELPQRGDAASATR